MRNVIGSGRKYFQTASLAVAFLLVSACGSMGLTPSPESVCREFPAVAEEADAIQTELATLAKPGRRIASENTTQDGLNRDSWLKWGESALKRTQWTKDAFENDKRGRKAVPALNEAGMSLVSFHGFIEQRKWKKAGAELGRVETNLRRARKVACDSVEVAVKPAKTAKAAERYPASESAPRKSKKPKTKKPRK